LLLNQPIERLLKELNASEEYWVKTKVQPLVAPTSINILRIPLVSVIQFTKYPQSNDFDTVMTGKYNQDCLEANVIFFKMTMYSWLYECKKSKLSALFTNFLSVFTTNSIIGTVNFIKKTKQKKNKKKTNKR
jgi:hypothetical protein